MATHDNSPDDDTTQPGRHRSSFVAPAEASPVTQEAEHPHHGAHSTHDDDELASALEAQVPATAAIPITTSTLPEIDEHALGWDEVDSEETGPQPTFSPWVAEARTAPIPVPVSLPGSEPEAGVLGLPADSDEPPTQPVLIADGPHDNEPTTVISAVAAEPPLPEPSAPEPVRTVVVAAAPLPDAGSIPAEEVPAAASPAAVQVVASAPTPGPVFVAPEPAETTDVQPETRPVDAQQSESFESLLAPLSEDPVSSEQEEAVAPPVAGVWAATPGAYGRRTELEEAPSTAKWVWFTIIAVLLSLLLGVAIYGLGLGAVPAGIVAAVGLILSFLPLLIGSASRRRTIAH